MEKLTIKSISHANLVTYLTNLGATSYLEPNKPNKTYTWKLTDTFYVCLPTYGKKSTQEELTKAYRVVGGTVNKLSSILKKPKSLIIQEINEVHIKYFKLKLGLCMDGYDSYYDYIARLDTFNLAQSLYNFVVSEGWEPFTPLHKFCKDIEYFNRTLDLSTLDSVYDLAPNHSEFDISVHSLVELPFTQGKAAYNLLYHT